MIVTADNGRAAAELERIARLEQRVRDLLDDLEQAGEIHREDERKLERAMEQARAAAVQLEAARRECARLRGRVLELEGRLQ